jgi:hypothetical protein
MDFVQFVFNIFIGAAIIGLWVLGFWFLVWKWFLQPLYFAWTCRQWAWLAFIAVFAFLGGLVYLYVHVDDYVVVEPAQYAKGDTICWHGRMYRVLGHDHDSIRCLHLGERGVRAVP